MKFELIYKMIIYQYVFENVVRKGDIPRAQLRFNNRCARQNFKKQQELSDLKHCNEATVNDMAK